MNTRLPTTDQFDIGDCIGTLMPTILSGETTRIPINRIYSIVVTAGSGTVEVDGHSFAVRKGFIIYALPNHLLSLRTHSSDFKTAYISFAFELISDFPLLLKPEISHYIDTCPCYDLCDTDYLALTKYHDLLTNRYQSKHASIEIIRGLLFSFVMEINRIYSGRNETVQASHQDKLTDGFFKLLHSHFSSEHSAAFYAQELCVSDKHLMRTIKKKTGHTFHFWLTDFLLRKAKLLLLSTDMTVIQIAESLHFSDSSAFAKFFRKSSGLSPIGFRKQRRK